MKDTREWLAGRGASESLLRTKKRAGIASAPSTPEAAVAGETVKREATRTANHREGDRYRLLAEVIELVHNGKRQTVTLINLSGGGAMIEGATGLKLWDRVLLQMGNCGNIEAAVRWVRGQRLGLEFAHETTIDASAEETARMLRAVINRSFPDVVIKADMAGGDPTRIAPERAAFADQAQAAAPDHSAQRDLRHPLIWSGIIHHDHDSFPVRLRNVSQGGALIQCDCPLRVGGELLLDLGETGSFFATVNWAHGDTAGLKFHAPFDLQLLAASKPSVASQRWVAPDYLRESHSANGPWAKQWGRSDLNEIHRNLGP